jgi:hypothetical protein
MSACISKRRRLLAFARLATVLPMALIFVASPVSAADEMANIHSVGIISMIGDFVAMKEANDFSGAFQQDSCDINVPDWAVDEAVRQQIASAIAPRIAVKTIVYSGSDFLEANPKAVSDNRLPLLKRLVQALPPQNAVDAYIIVRKRYVSSGEGPWLLGLGVLRSVVLFGAASAQRAYALFEVDVIDARTGEIIETGTNQIGSGWLSHSEPFETVDADSWTDSADSFTPERKQALRSVLMPLINKSLPYALLHAELIPELPKTEAPPAD